MNNSSVRRKTRLVLMVEDDDVVRELYGRTIRDAGLIVEEAINVAGGMALAPELRPDLIILDRHLPDGDGWDIARALKKNRLLPQTPIIGFTSNNRGRADVEDALVAGCDVFLEKPCSPDKLVRHVIALLGLPLPRSTGSSGDRQR